MPRRTTTPKFPDVSHRLDDPFPLPPEETAENSTLTLGNGDGSLDDEEAPIPPALVVNGGAIFQFFVKFMGNIRVYGQARAASVLTNLVKIANGYLAFTDVDGHPTWDTLPSTSYGCNMYTKGGKLIIQVNTGSTSGDVHYWYLDITGTSTTWTYSATAP